MVQTRSTMLPLGTRAPGFELPDLDGRTVTLDDFREASAFVVIFLSNHCPFVRHVERGLTALVRETSARGVAFVGIASNDLERYPQDGLDGMREQARRAGFEFPYLLDETQEIARAYRAACTPDFYVFDGRRELAYRGQMDGSRPGGNVPVTGNDLREALDAVLRGRPVSEDQQPSLGCNIKWKPGNEPSWFV